MSPGKKELPPPGRSNDLTALLRGRHVRTDDGQDPAPAPAPSAAPAVAQPPARAAKDTTMDRRSWYMPKASADALAAAIEELHWSTRQPKHVLLAALVDVALEHLDLVEQRVRGE